MFTKSLNLVFAGLAVTVAACSGIPECRQYLDECERGAPYTEERTAQIGERIVVAEPPPPPAPAPEPAPVVVEPPPPPPPPVVVDDTPVMTTAEPQFQQITK